MKKRILFLVNGYGLGNATRIHSIIQHLTNKCIIDVCASDNSLKYFKKVNEIDNLFPVSHLEYGTKNGQISFLETIKKIPQNFYSIYKTRQTLKFILRSNSYDLVVLDSQFSPLFLTNRPKLVSINNSDVIVKKILQQKSVATWQFFIEYLDYMYQLLVPDLVISPFFEPVKDTKKIRHVHLLARKEFSYRNRVLSPKHHHVLIVTGGVSALSHNLSALPERSTSNLTVLTTASHALKKISCESPTFNANELMNKSTIIVINGGFSSVSEALAKALPMIVIPLKGHTEQKINALWVEKNKLGVVAEWETMEDSINYIKRNYVQFKKHLMNYKKCNGSIQAASLIMKELEK